MLKFTIFLMALLIMPFTLIAAEDEGLYPAAPPANASFVRVVNISDTSMDNVSLAGISLPALEAKTASEYAVLTEGEREIKIADSVHNHTLVAGEYYTAAMVGETVKIIKDMKPTNPTKAVINFYNLSDIESVSLVSTTHNADIFKDVQSGAHDARDINAVSIGVAVKNGDAILKSIDDVKLERQISTSLFVIGQGETYDVITKNNAAYK